MPRRWIDRATPVPALVALPLVVTLASCAGGNDVAAPSSPAASSSSPAASPSEPSEDASPTPSATGSPGTGSEPPAVAAFQLCGTVLALSAGFIGQVDDEQLASGKQAAEDARAAYVDDGSGLAQKADAVIAAVEDATTPAVITTAQELADACTAYGPEE